MKHVLGFGLCAALFAVTSAYGQSGDEGLVHVPETAAVVVHVRGIAELPFRLERVLRDVAPGQQGQVMSSMVEQAYDRVLGGRSLEGLVENGHVFLVAKEFPGLPLTEPPKVALIAEVEDYAEFRNGILKASERRAMKLEEGMEVFELPDGTLYMQQTERFVIAGIDPDLVSEIAETQGGFEQRLGEEQTKTFVASDVAVYLDIEALFDTYGEFILEQRQVFKMGMIQGASQAGAPEEMAEIIDEIVALVIQALRDGRSLMIAAKLDDDEGVAFRGDLKLEPGSKSAGLFEGATPVDDSILEQLSRNFRMVSVTSVVDNPQMDRLMNLFIDQFGESKQGTVRENTELIDEADEYLTFDMFANNQQTRGITVNVCKDPGKMLEAELRSVELYDADVAGAAQWLTGPPVIERDALEHQGLVLHSISYEYDLAAMARLNGGDEAAAARQLGGERQTEWVGTKGEYFVRVAADDAEAAKEYLDWWLDGDDSFGSSAAYEACRQRLPETVHVLGLLEASANAQDMYDQFIASMEFGEPEDVPPPELGDERYVGFSMTMGEADLAMDMWIDLETWRRYFGAVQVKLERELRGF